MRSATIGLAAVLMAAACGGDGDEAPSGDAQKVRSLAQDERTELCEWLQDLEDKTISDEQICTQQGSQAADTTGDCEAQRDICLEEITGPQDCATFRVGSRCNATVAEFKSCLSTFTKRLNEATRRATCEDPTKGRLSDTLPAVCENVTPCLEFQDES